jgi:hypothetical protein
MTLSKKTIIDSFWFVIEVIGIFILVQLIRFIIGNLDALYTGISLILISAVLFLVAFIVTRSKDNRHRKKNNPKTFSSLFS